MTRIPLGIGESMNLRRGLPPSLDLDMLKQRYAMSLVAKNFADIFTFSRASTGTRINAAGVMETIAANQPRFDYDPVTLQPKGIWIEEQRTNLINNGNAAGAVSGTPGTNPTNWNVYNNGLSKQIVGTGIDSATGIPYVDIRIFGTTNTTNSTIVIGTNARVSISSATVYCISAYLALVGGGLSNVSSVALQLDDFNSGGSYVSTVIQQYVSMTPLLTRFCKSGTSSATGVTGNANLVFNHAIGVAVDFTVRIAGIQLEAGSFQTSYIPTSGSQVTRAADLCSINTLSPWYNAIEGSVVVETNVPNPVPAGKFPIPVQFAGSAGNTISVGFLTSTLAALEIYSGGGGLVNQYPASSSALRKIAAAFKQDSFSVCVNGGAVLSDSSGVMPTVTRMILGSVDANTTLNGYIKKVRYFPKRLAGAQLQALTA